MPGNANPSFSLTAVTTGLSPAPIGGGNTPLIIGWTQSGTFSGLPGQGPVGVSNLTTLTTNYGTYGNAVDAAALDLVAGANSVLLYKAFAGTVTGSNFTHTGTGTGTVAISGNAPLGPYGTATATGSTGPIILVTSSSNGTLYGTYTYSLDGGITYSAPANIVPTVAQNLGTTGMSIIFTGTNASGVWVANDTYIGAITTAVGQMFPYGGTTFTAGLVQTTSAGSKTVVGEGTFASAAAANPQDNFNVVIQFVTTGTLAALTAQYVYSLDGGITFSATQTIAATVTLPGGIVLTPADTGGPGGTQAGFVAGELYKFQTLGPQLTPTNILNILNSLAGNSNTWGWVHIPQPSNTVNTAATSGFELSTLFTNVEAGIANLWNSGRYVGAWCLYDTPTDTTASNIDATIEAWAATVGGLYSTVGTGWAAATISPANGWQLPRGSSWSVSARACAAPIGQDLGWVGGGPLIGLSQIYRNEANTPGLGPAGLAPLWTIAGIPGFFITNANLLVAAGNDINLAQYRRVINAACQAARSALIVYLNAGVRLTASGQIDPRDLAIIDNNTTAAVLGAIAGQASGGQVTIANTLGSGGVLNVTVTITALGYAKQISVTVGFISPALASQAQALP
jgi:hypothetical protein